jgi:hypothetical protein
MAVKSYLLVRLASANYGAYSSAEVVNEFTRTMVGLDSFYGDSSYPAEIPPS